MKAIEDCTAGIAGLGLMGGAFALALKKHVRSVLACDIDASVLDKAQKGGIIDGGFGEASQMLPRCDIVYLCLNPCALAPFMEKNMAAFKPGALVTDIAGVKAAAVRLAETVREDIDFIPGHPMAGSEKGGFAQAGMVDFAGKNYILTPLKRNRPENTALLKELIRRMGFGRITETSAAGHDSKIAFTSQLCHVIAAALVDCQTDTAITRYGGGSFEDLTRIAMLNAPMWTELFLANRGPLLSRIAAFEKSLDEIKALIKAGNAGELEERLCAVRERHERTVMWKLSTP